MKTSLMQYLVCPACGGNLSLSARQVEPTEEEGQRWDEVVTGSISCCDCGESFPIIGGVPRLLLGGFKAALQDEYPGAFLDAGSPRAAGTAPDEVMATMRSFGYEWRYFSDIRPEGFANFQHYFGEEPSILAGKVVLDAGCGKGRHAYHACRYAHTVIGADLSAAVDAAFANTRHLPNAHIMQADLFHLPFRRQSFDVVYSLGVLHHLPAPEAGFRSILGFVRPGGLVRIYLYWSMKDQPAWKRAMLWAVTQIRKVTTQMPFHMLRAFSWVVAALCAMTLVLAYRILRHTPLQGFAESLPLKTYADYPFRCLYQDQFDRFSAPIENRYAREQVAEWFHNAGLNNGVVVPAAGWLATARMPPQSTASNPIGRQAAPDESIPGASLRNGVRQEHVIGRTATNDEAADRHQ